MSENPVKPSEKKDEIELGQLFGLIGHLAQKFFRIILQIFLYFKRNFWWLAGLLIFGMAVGITLNKLVKARQKLDVIVVPNLETKNYLYDVVSEIQADLNAKDSSFFKSMGMDINKVPFFEITITALRNQDKKALESESRILETLKDFDNSTAISDILRDELKDKTTKEQLITFYFKNEDIGEAYARKILEYINSNAYYTGLVATHNANARERIRRNDSLVKQIDVLIDNYSKQMTMARQGISEGRIVLENQEPLNIPSLFNLKNELIRDTEYKKLELESLKNAITIINFGKPHREQKPLLSKNVIKLPLILLSLFFIFSFLKYLNKAAQENRD